MKLATVSLVSGIEYETSHDIILYYLRDIISKLRIDVSTSSSFQGPML